MTSSPRIAVQNTASLVFVLTAASLVSACGDQAGDPDTMEGAGETTASAAGDAGSGGTRGAPSSVRDAAAAPGKGSPGAIGAPGADGGRKENLGDAAASAPEGGAPPSGAGSRADAGRAADAGGAAGDAGGPGSTEPSARDCEVKPIATEMRSHYPEMSDPYYQKYASTSAGIIVATGSMVIDEAIVRYCRLLTEMWSNEKVREPALSTAMWFTMIGQKEQLSSLPQINKQYGSSLNARARGLGALTPTICAEDSIMCMPGDPWVGDCICPHETGHTLYGSGIAKNPELSSRLTAITNSARSSGRLANAYVWQDGDESGMMSWGVQAWYNCAINGTKGAYHTDINTRAELQAELPEFYQFLSELLPADTKYKDCYSKP